MHLIFHINAIAQSIENHGELPCLISLKNKINMAFTARETWVADRATKDKKKLIRGLIRKAQSYYNSQFYIPIPGGEFINVPRVTVVQFIVDTEDFIDRYYIYDLSPIFIVKENRNV